MIQPAVHAGHLEFVIEIRHRAQPAYNHAGADLTRETHQQAFEWPHFNHRAGAGRNWRHFRLHQFNALGQFKQRPLADIDGNPNHQAIHQPRGAADNVQMPIGHRIKRAWVKRNPFSHCHSPPARVRFRHRHLHQRPGNRKSHAHLPRGASA